VFPWPDSTFHFETEEAKHFMGSYWDPFFEDGAQEIVKKLPEVIDVADILSGFGSIKDTHRLLPETWAKGYHLIWPQPDRGVIITLFVNEQAKRNLLSTMYPFWPDGSRHRLIINEVRLLKAGVEAQISADVGGPELIFYDAHYLLNRIWYERGKEYDFVLTGIAYSARLAEDIEMPFTPNPDQMAWEEMLARQRGEELLERATTIRLGGSAFFLPIDDWDADDYSFRGPVKQVTPFSDFLGQGGWIVRTTVIRLSDRDPEDFDLNILVTAIAWDEDAPPEVGQDIPY
jgi:hypothetical protein